MLKNVDTEKALKSVRTCLGAIASPEAGPVDERMRMWWRQGTFVSILEPGAGAFREVVRLIETKGRIDDDREARDVLSREYIEVEVEELIGRFVARAAESDRDPAELTSKEIRAMWREWLKGFAMPSDARRHYTLVSGLVLDGPVQIGAVTLRPFDDASRKALLSECGLATGGSPDRESWERQLKEMIELEFPLAGGDVLADATVVGAEPVRARELFFERVREVLHVISFFRCFVWPVGGRVVIDLSGDAPSGSNVFVSVTPDGRISTGGARAALPCMLTSKRWEHVRRTIGFSLVSDLLSKPEYERTKLERSCINAIAWVSRGLQDNVADSRFLKLCIGMESLLLERGEHPLGSTMADRVAFLLGGTAEDRRRISAQLKEIYDVRSSIVHDGRSDEVEDQLGPAQLYATHAVRVFIRRMLQEKWESLDDFIEWFNGLKYG